MGEEKSYGKKDYDNPSVIGVRVITGSVMVICVWEKNHYYSIMIICVCGKDYNCSVIITCVWGKGYKCSIMIR